VFDVGEEGCDRPGRQLAHGPRIIARSAATVSSVPIYEYVCMECESHFEELVRGDEQVACPDCAAANVSRQFSSFAVHGLSKPVTAGGGGGCCGGSCGCGH
jgi:putative FmdB family regulatory protein